MPWRDVTNTDFKLPTPTPVEIVGTTFGNEIQNKILTQMRILNLMIFYFCVFSTARYFLAGN